METPAGGVSTYTYNDAYRKAHTLTNRTRVVTERAVNGRLVSPGTWTFAYGTGANEDTTIVSCACGTTTYRFNGTGLTGDFSGWKAGTLAEQTIKEPSGTLLEMRTFTWIRSEALSPDPVAGQSGVWSDPAVYAPLLDTQTITRGSQSWTTDHEYHTSNFNDYLQPWKVIETGQFTRTTERTFQSGFTPHIVGRVATQSVSVGAETVVATTQYALATGFVTSFVGPGSPLRQFVARTDGNLASEKDALNHETTYETYGWGKPQIVRTPKVRTDLTVNADGTIASVSGAVVVSFTYDLLFRSKNTSRFGVNTLVAQYDNIDGTGAWSERGSAFGGVLTDGFGRAVLQYASTGVKALATLDACGRPVTATLP